MSRLFILGAGQYGFVAKEVATAMGIFDQIDFLDDSSEIAVGRLIDIEALDYDAAFIAIGNPTVRAQWLQRIDRVTTLIHPTAVISPSATVGCGAMIEAGAVICTDVTIGSGTIVMANAVVGHNATVGSCCQLKYNSTVPERCAVPDRTYVDCNAVYSEKTAGAKTERIMEMKKNENDEEPCLV